MFAVSGKERARWYVSVNNIKVNNICAFLFVLCVLQTNQKALTFVCTKKKSKEISGAVLIENKALALVWS